MVSDTCRVAGLRSPLRWPAMVKHMRTNSVLLWTLGANALALCHCAGIRPSLNYSGFGEADPEKDERVIAKHREATLAPSRSAAAIDGVVVLIDTVPQGIEVEDGKIQVAEGYAHRLVGKFVLSPGSGWGFTALFHFSDYENSWRKPYCYPQVVLNFATLAMWGSLVPLSYPCWGDPSMTKQDVVREAKALAGAADGDLVILGYIGAGYQGDPNQVIGAAGYVLRADPRMKGGDLATEPRELSRRTAPDQI